MLVVWCVFIVIQFHVNVGVGSVSSTIINVPFQRSVVGLCNTVAIVLMICVLLEWFGVI